MWCTGRELFIKILMSSAFEISTESLIERNAKINSFFFWNSNDSHYGKLTHSKLSRVHSGYWGSTRAHHDAALIFFRPCFIIFCFSYIYFMSIEDKRRYIRNGRGFAGMFSANKGNILDFLKGNLMRWGSYDSPMQFPSHSCDISLRNSMWIRKV